MCPRKKKQFAFPNAVKLNGNKDLYAESCVLNVVLNGSFQCAVMGEKSELGEWNQLPLMLLFYPRRFILSISSREKRGK